MYNYGGDRARVQPLLQVAGNTRVSLSDPTLGFVQIRAGLHCGPVTGSVVGSLRPKYTLLGDTARWHTRNPDKIIRCICVAASSDGAVDPC